MSPATKKKALVLCDAKSTNDDRLGRYSDHEGGEAGPTWFLFNMAADDFAAHVAAAIEVHRAQQALL